MIKEFQGEYKWLSNFAPCKIYLNNRIFPSVEHAYMSEKCSNPKWKDTCTDENKHPGIIKKSSYNVRLVDNWEDIKIAVMTLCLQQKFNQEPYKTKLLNTGNHYLQEGNTWNDRFWGYCLKMGVGKNILGIIIMMIRDNLRNGKM